MAIKKTITTDSGVKCTYHKIETTMKPLRTRLEVIVYSYVNKTIRDKEEDAAGTDLSVMKTQVTILKDDIEHISFEDIYTFLKESDTSPFKGAEDWQ